MSLYATFLRPSLFRLDPERAHHLAMDLGARAAFAAPLMRRLSAVDDPRLPVTVGGLTFPTPIGLSAGFDKNGEAVAVLAGLGFGFVEIGSVSAEPSAGNPPPRLFRLPEDRALVVAYGVPNEGADAVAHRLAGQRLPVPLGINIVATNRGRGAPAIGDDALITEYMTAARKLAPAADYLMFNLSCPNTTDGCDFFADPARLDAWLTALDETPYTPRPSFLKVSPLGGVAMIEQLLEIVGRHKKISGLMFNLPSIKPAGLTTPESVWKTWPGAVSGPPAAALLDTCLVECFRRMDRSRYVLLASGGVSTAADAYAKIRKGASLVALLTALIYEGPGVVRQITRGLLDLMDRDGVKHISEVVGVDVV
ncbi:MAG: quinone-dependent dihydroorotate dehydrogenase [Rhodoplanes sp.]|uniref:quinone-dependent dihydroorotate dehydrogenase n=1 Tax=Rhodoplanes sp. TaxID=1968906 RepID=UPI0018362BEF|nr:quinone-dependent dihydroorotate dehydrogenase [Rhodoplanes sp.]NVO12857.1 quinone-dependent dihydroorotate dehydrogenase [Rhodoplanes sp.]